MFKKKMIIPAVLLLTITGFAAAGSLTGWFRTPAASANNLPGIKDEYRRLYERYMHNDSVLQLTGTITLFDGENRDVVKEKTGFRFIKQADQFYSQFSYLQTFYDGRLLVQLDTVNKIIVVAKDHKVTPPQGSFDVLFSDTASMKISGSIVQNKNGDRTLFFKSDFNPEVKRYSITYHQGAYQVKQATIEWWKDGMATADTEQDRVWISQADYQHMPARKINVGDLIARIITIKDDHIEAAPDYRQYKMHVTHSEQ